MSVWIVADPIKDELRGLGVDLARPGMDKVDDVVADMQVVLAEDFLDMTIETAALTEYWSGESGDYHALGFRNAQSITNLYERDTTVGGTDTLIDAANYELDTTDNVLYLLNGTIFTKGKRNWKSTYNCGWAAASIPRDILKALKGLVMSNILSRAERKDGAGTFIASLRAFSVDGVKLDFGEGGPFGMAVKAYAEDVERAVKKYRGISGG